jgi:ACR3 family arsenite transporter
MSTEPPQTKSLSLLDRFLSVWILIACGLGLGLGQLDGMINAIDKTSIDGTNILVAIGLILMMYPPLAKVRWEKMAIVFADVKLLILSICLNWILGPFLMYLLAIAFFGHQDRYSGLMSGLSLVGCARCIAMVLVWNDLSGGDNEYCAAIVALNSILTIALYSPFALFFIETLPEAMAYNSTSISIDFVTVLANVAIYMGIPFVLALLTYGILVKLKGRMYNLKCTYTSPS